MRKTLLFLITATLFGACLKSPKENPDGREVEIRLSTPLLTRSLEAESTISTVDILVFEGTPKTFKYRRYAWQKNGNLWSAALQVGTGQDIYFAINAREIIEAADAQLIADVTTWEEMQEALIMTNPQLFNLNTGTNNRLPMWGYSLNRTIADVPINQLGTVNIIRSVATVQVSFANDADFVLSEGTVAYGANKGFLAFSSDNTTTTPTGNFSTMAPEVPTDMVTTTEWSRAAQANNTLIYSFYMYENNAPTGSRDYTRIILKGRWNGSSKETYYPLAFRDPISDEKIPVKRNTNFKIRITKVNGDGYDTLEEAKNAEEVNMNFDIIPWDDEEDESIIIDGYNYIMLRPSLNDKSVFRSAVLYRTIEWDDRIVFKTNIPLDKFEMTLSPLGVFPDEEDKSLIQNLRFKVELESEEVVNGMITGYFQFTARLPFAEGCTYNPSVLTVRAGRIEFDINIEQRDREPGDWNDGGNQDIEFGY